MPQDPVWMQEQADEDQDYQLKVVLRHDIRQDDPNYFIGSFYEIPEEVNWPNTFILPAMIIRIQDAIVFDEDRQ